MAPAVHSPPDTLAGLGFPIFSFSVVLVVDIDLIIGSIASTDDPLSPPRCNSSRQLFRLCVFESVVVAGSVDVEDTVVSDAAVAVEAASSAMAMSSDTEAEAPERDDIAQV